MGWSQAADRTKISLDFQAIRNILEVLPAMGKPRLKKATSGSPQNQRRTRVSFAEMLSSANERAHETANRRTSRRSGRSVQAAIAAAAPEAEMDSVRWSTRLLRWLLALVLLPLCWVTLWTFLSQFSRATLHQGFWLTAEFWHFAIGVILMIGWFSSGLMETFFLYLYVLGHELTHAAFVYCCMGKVTDFSVSTTGGYITTTKTNLLIALSPYFVPIWSVVAVVGYCVLKALVEFSAEWDKVFYGVLGLTWTFHVVWTLWMLPKDQPDLKESGRLLSLVVIMGGNLLVLVALFCVAGRGPVLANFADFGHEWVRYAATWGDAAWRGGNDLLARLVAAGGR
jgi:hypothetical protein